jgi:hypothetical protein
MFVSFFAILKTWSSVYKYDNNLFLLLDCKIVIMKEKNYL